MPASMISAAFIATLVGYGSSIALVLAAAQAVGATPTQTISWVAALALTKGSAAAGLGYLYQTLTEKAEDEAFSEYGLIAEKVSMPEDRSSVTFYINPKARFSDNSAITASDVEFSFKTLTTHEQASPFFSAYYADVDTVKIVNPLTIQFIFKNNQNKELPLILGQIPIFSKAYWTTHDFGKSSLKIIFLGTL